MDTFTETYYDHNKNEISTKWVKGERIGKGAFSKVYILTNETKTEYAGKIIKKSSLIKNKDKDQLQKEIKIHRSLEHPNIVKFISHFETADLHIIKLELCSNQSMRELLKIKKRLSETKTRHYLTQIVSAVKYLHENRIIHRDLKLGNLFVTSNFDIKIGDFGLATQLSFDGERLKNTCGTPNYLAPEVLDVPRNGYSFEADIWSLGVILYVLLVGQAPFETSDVKTTYRRIRETQYCFPTEINISNRAKSLITQLLRKRPEKRLKINEILKNEFLSDTSKMNAEYFRHCTNVANEKIRVQDEWNNRDLSFNEVIVQIMSCIQKSADKGFSEVLIGYNDENLFRNIQRHYDFVIAHLKEKGFYTEKEITHLKINWAN